MPTYVGNQIGEILLAIAVLQVYRRMHGNIMGKGDLVHRAQPLTASTPGGPGRLSVDRHHLMRAFDQRVKRRDRKIGGAHEDDAQTFYPCFLAGPVSLAAWCPAGTEPCGDRRRRGQPRAMAGAPSAFIAFFSLRRMMLRLSRLK